MKKQKRISLLWSLFFATMGCLVANQWEWVFAVLAGFMLAWWLTSRIKIKLFYATWFIFPFLCFFCLNSAGNRVVEWTNQNSPKFVAGRAVYYAVHNLTYKTPEPKQWLINKTRDVFQKSVSKAKGITKKISEKNYRTNQPPN